MLLARRGCEVRHLSCSSW